MKNAIDKITTGVIVSIVIIMTMIIFFTEDGRSSFWLVPLAISLTTTHFASSAYGSKNSVIPKDAAKIFFWFSLVIASFTTLVAIFGDT